MFPIWCEAIDFNSLIEENVKAQDDLHQQVKNKDVIVEKKKEEVKKIVLEDSSNMVHVKTESLNKEPQKLQSSEQERKPSVFVEKVMEQLANSQNDDSL